VVVVVVVGVVVVVPVVVAVLEVVVAAFVKGTSRAIFTLFPPPLTSISHHRFALSVSPVFISK